MLVDSIGRNAVTDSAERRTREEASPRKASSPGDDWQNTYQSTYYLADRLAELLPIVLLSSRPIGFR